MLRGRAGLSRCMHFVFLLYEEKEIKEKKYENKRKYIVKKRCSGEG